MVSARTDAGQHPSGGRLAQALVGAGLVAALLTAGGTPEHGVRSAEAAASTARTAAVSSAAYELVSSTGTKRPLRWLACRSIAYRINPAGMPRGMDAVVKRVMGGIGKQTGVSFRYAGTTQRTFGATSRPSSPTIYFAFTAKRKAYGHTFAYPGEIGVGGPNGAWYQDGGGHRYEAVTSGRVLLSTAFEGPLTGAGASWPSLIRHEVGHALNLAHRSAGSAVMNAVLSGRAPAKFSRSEVAALKKVLQRTGCDYRAWSKL